VLYLLACTPLGVPRTLAPALYWQWTVQHYLYAGAAFFLLLPFVFGSGGAVGRALGSPFAHYLGNISYSVYLWHVAMMPVVQRNLGFKEFGGHFPEILAVTALCATAAATVSWYCIEQPILRYGSRPWRGARTPAPIAHETTAATQSS
jgi:peptidoglycan/LPS O-acetylase OafA/YrhL